MIAPDSPAWAQLQDAYGAASDIPDLLRQLATNPRPMKADDQPWHSLWSALCHQEDVYTASYAAVPHIVHLAELHPDKATMSYFLLPTAIEIDRVAGRGPALPLELEQEYFESLKHLGGIAAQQLEETTDGLRLRYLRGAVAIGQGDTELADRIIDPEDEDK